MRETEFPKNRKAGGFKRKLPAFLVLCQMVLVENKIKFQGEIA